MKAENQSQFVADERMLEYVPFGFAALFFEGDISPGGISCGKKVTWSQNFEERRDGTSCGEVVSDSSMVLLSRYKEPEGIF